MEAEVVEEGNEATQVAKVVEVAVDSAHTVEPV